MIARLLPRTTDRARFRALYTTVLCLVALLSPLPGFAQGTGQLATGGATMIEGTAGGGIVPWAVLNGYATREEVAYGGVVTHLDTGDYRLDVIGASVNINNRVELSVAQQELDLVTLGPMLGIDGARLEQNVFGAKVRLAGDVIYTRMPQVTLGVQYKDNTDFAIPGTVGAADDSGIDVYLSAAKLFLGGAAGYNLFLNGTLRYTEANETGLLGFGGPGGSDYSLNLEAAVGVLINRRLAIGAEYRQKSSNLPGLPEDDWYDVFVAWFPNRNFSVVGAYVDLGEVATLSDQSGWYLSLEGSF